MNVDKVHVNQLREGVRMEYPNYKAGEWVDNKKKWENPKDTFSVPTGMFKDQEGCNDKPVTISATILNRYGDACPKRKNVAYITSNDWDIDSKVVSTKVQANPDSVTFNYEEVANCLPDLKYMEDNPVRATLYHKKVGFARIVRRLQWHSDMVREGIEVRQCAWWDESFSTNGAWNPRVCK